jgi:hypothetical protein
MRSHLPHFRTRIPMTSVHTLVRGASCLVLGAALSAQAEQSAPANPADAAAAVPATRHDPALPYRPFRRPAPAPIRTGRCSMASWPDTTPCRNRGTQSKLTKHQPTAIVALDRFKKTSELSRKTGHFYFAETGHFYFAFTGWARVPTLPALQGVTRPLARSRDSRQRRWPRRSCRGLPGCRSAPFWSAGRPSPSPAGRQLAPTA